MSLSSILGIASSGVATAQTSLRTVADNISNVNTKGYVRKIVEQTSLTSDGRRPWAYRPLPNENMTQPLKTLSNLFLAQLSSNIHTVMR